MKEENIYDIFISYSRIDISIASQIYRELKELGLCCFFDTKDIKIGDDFTNTIQSAIINSKCIIFICGDNTENSVFQRRELDLSLEIGKKVYSLFTIRSCDESIIHSILANRTFCCRTIDNLYENIQEEFFYKYKRNNISTPAEADTKYNSQYCNGQRKVLKKKYILLAIISLFVVCLFFLINYICSLRFTEDEICLNPPYQSENIADSTSVSQTLDRDTIYISFEENEKSEGKTRITQLPQLFDWESFIWINRCKSALAGLLLGIILVPIIKVCKKKNNIKLSSDVNSSISIDGNHIAKINAGNVISTHLSKGEYLIEFQSNKEECNRIVQKISDTETHVIYSEFLNRQEVKFRCFIAGSLALSTERNALIAVASKLGNRWEPERFRISSYTFEDFNRDVVPGGQQKLYDSFIENDANWCVFIISNGIGEKTLNEYKVAMNSLQKIGHPKILFLASTEPINDETLSVIKREIIDANQYWNTYNNLEHMQSIFRECIEWDITLLSKTKRQNLV